MRPDANFLTNRGDAYQATGDYDRAIADYDAALKKDPKFQRAWNNRGRGLARQGRSRQGDAGLRRGGASQSFDKTAASNYQDIAVEVQRLNLLGSAKNLPSFNCATVRRAVEKAICADPGLAELDRNII